jgi:hypothetical protein
MELFLHMLIFQSAFCIVTKPITLFCKYLYNVCSDMLPHVCFNYYRFIRHMDRNVFWKERVKVEKSSGQCGALL